jgi:hypothetical protein
VGECGAARAGIAIALEAFTQMSSLARRIAFALKTAVSTALALALVTSATPAQADAKTGGATASVLAQESAKPPEAKSSPPHQPSKAKVKPKAKKAKAKANLQPRDTKAKLSPKPARGPHHAPRSIGKPEPKVVPPSKGPKRRA